MNLPALPTCALCGLRIGLFYVEGLGDEPPYPRVVVHPRCFESYTGTILPRGTQRGTK